MVKKVCLLFISLIIFIMSLYCCIGVTYADTNFTPTYTFTGSNLGYVSSGIIGNYSVDGFDDLIIYNLNQDGFNTRLGFSTTALYDYGFDSFSPIDFTLNYQCNNRNEYLRPLPRIKNVNDTLSSGGVVNPTFNSADYSYSFTFHLFGSMSSSIFDIDNIYNTGSIICSGFVPCNIIQYTGSASQLYSYNYFAFKLGDMSAYKSESGSYYNNGVAFVENMRTINVVTIELGSSKNWSYSTSFDNTYTVGNTTFISNLSDINIRFNYVLYTFDSGLQFLYVFGCQYYNSSAIPPQNDTFYWDKRIYYVSSDLFNNSIYNQGYNSGYDYGYSLGESNGRSIGFDLGQNYGYGVGYSQGVNDSGNYTFFSLISAVIDAPITAFKSLFNFNFLGVNLLDFVTGLITLCFAIWVLRLVL